MLNKPFDLFHFHAAFIIVWLNLSFNFFSAIGARNPEQQKKVTNGSSSRQTGQYAD